MKHIVNLSGGKDSTAMLLMMLDRGMPIDYIVFADTGKDFPQMLEHLDALEQYVAKNYPTAPKFTRLSHEKGFDFMMFKHRKTRGKYQDTPGNGWASFRNRWCTARLKVDVINKFCKTLGDECMQYIGIAVDEPKRLRDNPHMRYPLAEWNITEAAALDYCYTRGFRWGGLYEHFDRVSCWCCPLQPLKALRTLWQHHPELWTELRDMDARSCNTFRSDYTVVQLEERFMREARAEYNDRKTQAREAADALSCTPLQQAESAKINAFVGKVVEIEFTDGGIDVGILHKDTLATYTKSPEADNTKIRGYYIERDRGELHFKKSHVKKIALAQGGGV
nr:MAG TPA: phosphoadenosine-phosphosulfate reductase [Caudoviricetes sp.]